MSLYILDKNNQIYGDYIKRLGEVLETYNGKYEVTLAISTLQSLLTVLTESKLYQNKKDVFDSLSYAEEIEQKKILNKTISNNSVLGLNKDMILNNTFCNKKTIKDILQDMRNALSHPVAYKNSDVPKTGFYTIQNKVIEKIVFVNSPDSEGYKRNFNKFEEFKEKSGFPLTAQLVNNKVFVDGKEYRRFIEIELTPMELKSLVLNLCEMFSEFIMYAENPKNAIKMLADKFAA